VLPIHSASRRVLWGQIQAQNLVKTSGLQKTRNLTRDYPPDAHRLAGIMGGNVKNWQISVFIKNAD
jgi:hypothetical protein